MSDKYKTLDSKSRSNFSRDPIEIIGFINNWGESNCFLNSALQIIYHLIPFRSSLKSYPICSKSKSHFCLVCGLKEIFSTYSSRTTQSNSSPIDITKFRSELAKIYSSKNLFAINEPADSMEALSAILSSFHNDLESKCSFDCPVHSMFSLYIEESMICKCGAIKTDVWDSNTFSQPFYVNDIFEEIQGVDQYEILKVPKGDFEEMMSVSNVLKFENRLQDYIRSQWAGSIFEVCPKDCRVSKSHKLLRLCKAPKVFVVNMIWRDFNPRLNKILQALASISYTVSLDSVYEYSSHTVHTLRSTILYGRGHYICAIRLGPLKQWYKIDDERGRIINKGTWLDLVQDCLSNRYYPVGLFYEESNKREETEIAPKDWISLERRLLEYLKNIEDTEEDKDWVCACGRNNNAHWSLCSGCNKLKPGLSGWICMSCTYLNKNEHGHCRSCTKRRVKDCISSCACKRSPCVCPKLCDKCGNKYTDTCKSCFTGIFCSLCNLELNKVETQICGLCHNKSDGRNCSTCKVEINKKYCEDCIKKFKQCKTCGKFSEQDEVRCSYSKCKNVFSLHQTLNSKKVNGFYDTEENNKKVLVEWKCESCEKIRGVRDKKFCDECFENKKICNGCKGTLFYCEGCFITKIKCELCGKFIVKNEKCSNKDCASNHQESIPNRIEDSIPNRIEEIIPNRIEEKGKLKVKNCLMCERSLPEYGFCLSCKLKLKADRCSLCDSNRNNEYCENCVQYTKLCKACSKHMHITQDRCVYC